MWGQPLYRSGAAILFCSSAALLQISDYTDFVLWLCYGFLHLRLERQVTSRSSRLVEPTHRRSLQTNLRELFSPNHAAMNSLPLNTRSALPHADVVKNKISDSPEKRDSFRNFCQMKWIARAGSVGILCLMFHVRIRSSHGPRSGEINLVSVSVCCCDDLVISSMCEIPEVFILFHCFATSWNVDCKLKKV